MIKVSCALKECQMNSPSIEINQVWVGYNEDGEVLRKIRILARHPDDIDNRPAWIYTDLPSKMFRLEVGRMGVCPELNLRIVFRPEHSVVA